MASERGTVVDLNRRDSPRGSPRSPKNTTYDTDENTASSVVNIGATPLHDEIEHAEYPRRTGQEMFQSYAAKKNLRKVRILLLITGIVVAVVLLVIIAFMLVPRIINYTVRRNLSCSFSAVMLGVGGGLTEENLSGVLISRGSNNRFIALDAGSLLYGIRRFLIGEGLTYTSTASSNSNLYFPFPGYASRDVQRAGYLIRNHVFAYFIGHPHLDHVAGLVLNSPQDYFDGADGTPADDRPKAKAIVGLPSTLSALNSNVFNNKIWPNLPQITQRYEYRDIITQNEYHVNDLLGFTAGHVFNEAFDDVAVKFFEICHADVLSTAFLFTAKNDTSTERQILYLSDTGLSAPVGNVSCDWRDKLNVIWKDPSLNVRLLTGVFVEVSSNDETSDQALFGHLRPADLMTTLSDLKAAQSVTDLSGLRVIIQHIKPSFDAGDDPKDVIGKQVQKQAEKYGINAQFLFPTQGDYLCL